MSHYIYDEYYIDIPQENLVNPFSTIPNNEIHPIELENAERFQNTTTTNNIFNNNLNPSTHPISLTESNNISPWRPNDHHYMHVYNKFHLSILKEYPNTPCVYCGRLLYKNKATWIPYDHSETYPIETVNEINVFESYATLRRQILKVPSCSSCTKPQNRFQYPILAPIPNEISQVPLHRRKFLSPIYLHCSLGRKLRHHKNTQRILHKKNIDRLHRIPTSG